VPIEFRPRKRNAVQCGFRANTLINLIAEAGSWGHDGNIVLATTPFIELSSVPASGGTPQRVTKLASGEVKHRWPQLLPGDRAILFTAAPTPVGMIWSSRGDYFLVQALSAHHVA
jgi:hypothetical protein